jgi:hypothetical protein
VPPAALEPPREVPNGPGSKTVTGYLEKITPDGSTLKTATDYPDLRAATASYTTPDGNLITLAMQRMSRPLSLQSFTHRYSPEGLSELPSGTQVVNLRSALPGVTPDGDATALEHMQVVLARPVGILLTLTVVSGTPGGQVMSSATGAPDVLVAKIIETLDVASVDRFMK